MRPRFAFLTLLLLLALLALTPQAGFMQSGTATCPAVVEQALTQIDDNCAAQDRNTVCYGFPRVVASFAEAVAADFFTHPADRASLAALQTLQTFPFDPDTGEWGIALMKAQANIPDTLPGQAVTFVLLGEAEVENAVEPAAADAAAVSVIAQAQTDVFRAPGGEKVGAVPGGTVMDALELSVDSGWLNIRAGDVSGWIPRAAVNANPRIDELPAVGQPRFNPMQAFYLRSVPGELRCQDAPSVLAVQSPEGITVDLTANGANIRLGSLILLRILPPGDVLQLTTLEGQAVLDAGTLNEVVVPAGMTSTRCLEEPDNLGIDGQANDRQVGAACAWQPPAPVTPDQQAENAIIQRIVNRLNPPPVEVVTCPTGTTTTHVVQRGETLFRIALRYRTTVATVAAANNLADPQKIFAGQSLTIPCGVDTGLPSVPPTAAPVTLVPPVATTVPPVTTSEPPVTAVDCSTFAPTSPLDGLPYGNGTFYWNPARGAASYRLNLYNEDERKGMLVASLASNGADTQLTANLTTDAIGYGFRFSWEVLAFTADGTLACTTKRVLVPRAAPADQQPAATPEATP